MAIYHFHATKQISPEKINHYDGILERTKKIEGNGDYKEIKVAIAGFFKIDPDGIVLHSLSRVED